MTDRRQPPPIHHFEHLELPPCRVLTPMPGLTLHLLDTGELPANSVTVAWNAGKATPRAKIPASLLPTLMTEGTANMTGAQLTDTIEFNGAWQANGVMNHYSRLGITSLNDTTPRMLELLGDMLTAPSLPADAFDAIRARELASCRLNATKVDGRAADVMANLIAGDTHPYLRATEPSQIEAVIHSDMIDVATRVLGHTAVDIFAVGQLNAPVMEAIEKLAARITPADTQAGTVVVKACPTKSCRVDIPMPDKLQSAIRCVIPVIGRSHSDYEDLRTVVIALGGYFGSRLMTSIREEQGLTYGIQASLYGTPEVAYVGIEAQCDPANIEAAINGIAAELQRLARESMEAGELQCLRSEVLTRLASILDSPLSIMSYYQSLLTADIPDGYFERQFKAIRNITPDRIRDIAARYLDPSRMLTVTCG